MNFLLYVITLLQLNVFMYLNFKNLGFPYFKLLALSSLIIILFGTIISEYMYCVNYLSSFYLRSIYYYNWSYFIIREPHSFTRTCFLLYIKCLRPCSILYQRIEQKHIPSNMFCFELQHIYQSPRKNFFFRYYLSSVVCMYVCGYVCMYVCMSLRLQPHRST